MDSRDSKAERVVRGVKRRASKFLPGIRNLSYEDRFKKLDTDVCNSYIKYATKFTKKIFL